MAVSKRFTWTDPDGESIEVNIGADGDNVDINGESLTDKLNSMSQDIDDLLETKDDVTSIITSSNTTVTLSDNTETRCGEVTSLSLSLPSDTSNDYISSVIFTSGTTETSLIYPETINMIGTDCTDNIFVPIKNKRYTIIVTYDGVGLIGTVGGYVI